MYKSIFGFLAKSEVASEVSQPASVKGKEETLKRAKLLEGLYNQFLVIFHCLYRFYRCLTSYHFYIKVSECKEPFIIVFAISFFLV